MTLDEYEKLMEEKRANLNKKVATETKVDPKAFEGMKAYTRKNEGGDNHLELTTKKQIGIHKSGQAEKTRKEVGRSPACHFRLLLFPCSVLLPSLLRVNS